MKYRAPPRPSQRALRNHLAFLSGETVMEQAKPRTFKAGGKQPEGLVNKANQQAARLIGGELYRNARGMMPTPSGGMRPYGLGPNGAGDLIGPIPMVITKEMVGRTVAIYSEVESKTDTGVVAPHQTARIEHLRNLGAIAGVSRNADEFNAIIQAWRRGYGC